MNVSIKDVCNGFDFVEFFDEAIIERCHYVNAQEERVEQVHKLEGVMINVSNSAVQISAYDPLSCVNAPLAAFRVRGYNYQKQRNAEFAIADHGIVMIKPVILGILENSTVNYFSLIQDGNKMYSYLILNPPQRNDYYYRIEFK